MNNIKDIEQLLLNSESDPYLTYMNHLYHTIIDNKDLLPLIVGSQSIQKQIDMLEDYNLSGFAIYYYWFSKNTITNENMILYEPINIFFSDVINCKNKKIFFLKKIISSILFIHHW